MTDKNAGQKKTGILTISKAGKVPLSRNQQEFNKQTARIEKLRKEIDKKQAQYDEAIHLYRTSIHPLQVQLVQQRRVMLDLLWPFFKKQLLPKGEQAYLKKLLKEQLQFILDHTPGMPDQALKKMFIDLAGERYETARKREEAELKDEMQEAFDDAGIDFDLTNVDLTSEELAEKMAEAQRKMQEQQQKQQQQWEQRRAARKKTPRQLEKEKLQQQVEEMKQKNISTIYRQLAKLFHPDLEQDEQRRAEKEVLMKELTTAYEAKNLHALLTLELKWIHNETSHLETLTDEKLAVYLQILREQAIELEREKYQLLNKPQYQVLVQEFGYREMTYPVKSVLQEQQKLESTLTALKEDEVHLQSNNALKYVKQLVREYKETQEEEEANLGLDKMIQMMMKEAGGKYGWG